MQKLYPSAILTMETTEGEQFLSDIIAKAAKVKAAVTEEEYEQWQIFMHDTLRDHIDMPNQIFGLGTKDGTPVIFLFDLKPDGHVYQVCQDEDTLPYIIISEK